MTDQDQTQLEQSTSASSAKVETPGALTVAEAVAQFVTSEKTVRRWLTEGKLADAFQVSGAYGQEWRVPVQSLLSAGFVLRDQQQEQTAAATGAAGELLEELRAQRDRLQSELDRAQQRAEASQRLLEERTGKESDLQRELGRLEGEVEGLREQLAEASRHWWQRKPKPVAKA